MTPLLAACLGFLAGAAVTACFMTLRQEAIVKNSDKGVFCEHQEYQK